MFKIVPCKNCSGRGYPVQMNSARFGEKIEPQPECPACKGAGTIKQPV
jgi:DnaJ-class molecular chaperone